jgi:hypothetical protein
MEKWEKKNRFIFVHQTGDPNLSLKVMFSYFSKPCMAQSRPPDDGKFSSWNE